MDAGTNPNVVEAAKHLAAGNTTNAETLCREVLRQNPNDAPSLHVLGLVMLRKKQFKASIRLLERAVRLAPGVADFHCNLGAALGTAGRLDEAAIALRRAIELRPDQARTHANLGASLLRQGNLQAAAESFMRSLELQSDLEVRVQLGNIFEKLERLDDAEIQFRTALEIDPDYVKALKGLSVVLNRQARQPEAITTLRHAVEVAPDDAALHGGMLYDMHYCPDLSPEEIFQEHLRWAQRHEEPLKTLRLPHDNDRSLERRLRVGYVSPDFRYHSAAAFFQPLLSNHDRAQVEVFCYFAGGNHDAKTEEFRALADVWREIQGLDDDQVAKLIRSDRIDILIDLTGHMAQNRLLVFARQPAPIQVAYIGHPNTRGMASMNYRISDLHLDPFDSQSERFSSESLIRLPQTYACYQRPTLNIPVAPLPAIRNGYFTFGCLNNSSKLTAPAIALWCRIMNALPGSRIILNADGDCRHLRSLFSAAGIDVDSRIIFTGSTTYRKYLEQFNEIDLALDPFPYSGHTTTCDGVWMGVPPITLAGETFVSRTGLCILTQIGVPELIASSAQEFVSKVTDIVADLGWLASLRRTLRDRLSTSTLTDGAALARDIERAYREMWWSWCDPLAPGMSCS